MIGHRHISALALAAVLTGCSILGPTRPPSDSQIERWVSQHQYGAAIDALEAHADTPARRQTLARIRVQAEAYDQRTARRVERHIDQRDWQSAFSTLQQGLANYPEGERLKAIQVRLRKVRTRRLRKLQAELITARGQWLADSAPLYQEIAATEPDDRKLAWKAQRLAEEAKKTAERLLVLGQDALSRRDLERAGRYLRLAARLDSNKATTSALARLRHLRQQREAKRQAKLRRQRQRQERAKAEQDQQRRAAQAAQRQRRAHELTQEARQALREEDLPRARRLLGEARALDSENTALGALDRDLGRAIAARVQRLLERGNAHYTAGRIEKAKQVWEKALELDPNNTHVRSRVSRADRVLENLHEIKRREQAQP